MEANIEKRLMKSVKAIGGRAIKLNPLWNIGIPARSCGFDARVIRGGEELTIFLTEIGKEIVSR